MAGIPWRIHGTDIFTNMNGWFLWEFHVAKYVMDLMGWGWWYIYLVGGCGFSPTHLKNTVVKMGSSSPPNRDETFFCEATT